MRKEIKVDEYGNPVEKSRVGTAFTVMMGLISLAIFLIVFLRIFQARDSKISDDVILDRFAYRFYSAAALQVKLPTEEDGTQCFQPLAHSRFCCYSVHPSTTMDTDGRIQLREVYYLESADNLQMTLRLNTKYYPEESGLGYDFALRLIDAEDGSSEYCTEYYLKADVRNGYTFLRIAFTGVELKEAPAVRLLMLPQGAEPTDSAYLNLKVYGSDVYTQQDNVFARDVHRV